MPMLVAKDMISGVPKEGELYKKVNLFGKSFELYYGYYEEFERFGKYNDPIPIYPDFKQAPLYTDDGTPFVTAMQDPCENYQGMEEGDCCSSCIYFRQYEELFGLCSCERKKAIDSMSLAATRNENAHK